MAYFKRRILLVLNGGHRRSRGRETVRKSLRASRLVMSLSELLLAACLFKISKQLIRGCLTFKVSHFTLFEATFVRKKIRPMQYVTFER